MKPGSAVIAVYIILMLSSCVRQKNLIYLKQGKDKKVITREVSYNRVPYKIKAGDNLDIKFSSTDPSTSAILNRETGIHPPGQVNAASLYVQGYSVSDAGIIHLPIIGDVKAVDLTIAQLTDSLTTRLEDVLTLKNVNVKISNFRVSVVGEVKDPGVQFVYSDNLNIFQALSLAGDLTDLGDRKRIKIIRNNESNTGAQIAYLDITQPDCISSEYYFIQPNDVIYVTPVRLKAVKTNLAIYQAAVATVTAIYLIFKLIQLQ